MQFKPSTVALTYIGSVFVFAALYYAFKDRFDELRTPWDSIYFSVVTITTLGYGEIVPTDTLGKVLVSLQALLGVGALGLLFVSVGQSISEASAGRQKLASKQNFIVQYHAIRDHIFTEIMVHLPDPMFETIRLDEDDPRDFYSQLHYIKPHVRKCSEQLAKDLQFYIKTIGNIKVLEQNLSTFIQSVPIEDPSTLQVISTYQIKMQRLQSLGISTDDEREHLGHELHKSFENLHAFKGDDDNDELLTLIRRS